MTARGDDNEEKLEHLENMDLKYVRKLLIFFFFFFFFVFASRYVIEKLNEPTASRKQTEKMTRLLVLINSALNCLPKSAGTAARGLFVVVVVVEWL